MEETLNIYKEFHAMPPKEKVSECSKDPNRSCKLYTSSENYKKDAIQYWKDSLTHPCPPSGQSMEYWPKKPLKILSMMSNGRENASTAPESIIKPVPVLINGTTPPVYKSLSFTEFRRRFFQKGPKFEVELQ
ncbi:hypothetical protein RJT34_28063 [Clitoria ternatea]|uniref:Uncharacterized protein n=1 Tax=Clitoria ternatea TaxID=43366 RepID=A0AAN9I8U1_CLITE